MEGKISRIDEIILHIGTEKTGTTSIQETLAQNRSSLIRQGVLYPTKLGMHHTSQWEVVAAVHNAPWTHDFGQVLNVRSERDQARFRETLISSLRDEIAQHRRISRLIISSEHLHSRLTDVDEISALRELLSNFSKRVRVVIYFRRQDEVGLAFQSTRLKSLIDIGATGTNRLLAGPPGYFYYDALYSNWAGVFGQDEILARLYHKALEQDRGLIGDFADVCGIVLNHRPEKFANRSLGRKGFHFLKVLNKNFPVDEGWGNASARKALITEIERRYSGKYRSMSRAQIEAWYGRYKRTNENLRKLAFPEMEDPIFSEDFSDYPAEADDSPPSYEDAVEIALSLWSAKSEKKSKRSRLRTLLNWIYARS